MKKHKAWWSEQKQETFYEYSPNSVSVEERILSYLCYIYSKKAHCNTQTPKTITIHPQYAQSLYPR